MKDEIKEIILDDLKLKDIRYHKCKEKDLSFNTEDYQAHLLLDYIINLQEKYEEADYDRHKLFEQKEKAIEKIKGLRIFGLRSGKTLISTLLNEVLDILEGDKDE